MNGRVGNILDLDNILRRKYVQILKYFSPPLFELRIS
jgi:hypothetical protein